MLYLVTYCADMCANTSVLISCSIRWGRGIPYQVSCWTMPYHEYTCTYCLCCLLQFGGSDLLHVYNAQQIKNRFNSAGVYVVNTRVSKSVYVVLLAY